MYLLGPTDYYENRALFDNIHNLVCKLLLDLLYFESNIELDQKEHRIMSIKSKLINNSSKLTLE